MLSRRVSFAAMAALVLALGPVAGRQPQPLDVSAIGPQVGARVPEFSLVDQHGATRTLDSIMGPRGAMIVFNRSADW